MENVNTGTSPGGYLAIRVAQDTSGANPANAQFIQEKEKKEQNDLPFVVQQ